MKSVLSVCLILWLSGAGVGYGGDIYVWSGSPSPGAGGTWDTAYHTIQEAVDAASAGDTVWVTNGTYRQGAEITVTAAITVRSVNGASATTVDGEETYRCFKLGGDAVIDGFTIRNGRSTGTAGTQGAGPGVTGGNGWHGIGGGVWCDGGGTVQYCVITGNEAHGGLGGPGGIQPVYGQPGGNGGNGGSGLGGGVYCSGDGTVRGCLVTGNEAHGGRGGQGSPGGNWLPPTFPQPGRGGDGGDGGEGWGGGVYCYSGGTVQNCTVVSNSANHGYFGIPGVGGQVGGQHGDAGSFGNGSGGGVYRRHSGTVKNSIILSNTATEAGPNWARTGSGGFSYCCTTDNPDGPGNVTGDPRFLDESSGNYRLGPGSSCINSGMNEGWMTGATDLDGNSRIIGDTVDIGAYEAALTPVHYVSFSGSDTSLYTGWATAASNLQAAIDVADPGDQIWIAAGVHYPSNTSGFMMRRGVDLYGGFEGSESLLSERDWVEHLTILSGDVDANDAVDARGVVVSAVDDGKLNGANSRHVLYWDTNVVAYNMIDGLFITAGLGTDMGRGGGIRVESNEWLTVRHCTITGNRAGDGAVGAAGRNGNTDQVGGPGGNGVQGGSGGGISVAGGTVRIESTVVAGNRAGDGGNGGNGGTGGGSSGSTGKAGGDGGNGGAGGYGGGISVRDGEASLFNVTVAANAAGDAGSAGQGGVGGWGSRNQGPSGLPGDAGADGAGGGMSVVPSGDAELWNSVVRGNQAATGAEDIHVGSMTLDASHCVIPANTTSGTVTRTEVRNVDPRFQSPAAGDYRLRGTSPCIDAGVNQGWMDTAADLGANARISGSTVDIGAYEYVLPFVDITDTDAVVAGEVTSVEIRGTNDDAVVGTMWWTNSATGGGDTFAASPAWDFTVSLGLGANVITVFGRDAAGAVGSDSVTITRSYEHGGVSPVHYVAKNGGNVWPFTSWADAATSLDDAIRTAREGDEVWIAKGVYHPEDDDGFVMGRGVDLYGGFAGGEGTRERRDWRSNLTVLSGDRDRNDGTNEHGIVESAVNPGVLSGDNSRHVLHWDGATAASNAVDGVVITAGLGANGSRGGGIHVPNNQWLTVRNCTVCGNRSGTGVVGARGAPNQDGGPGGPGGTGGGVYVAGGAVFLLESVVSGNRTGDGGIGGMGGRKVIGFMEGGVGGQGGLGGGLHLAGGESTVLNCAVVGNGTGIGGMGGFGAPQGDQGAGGDGGGVWVSNATTIANATFAENHAFGNGGGLHCGGSGTLRDAILYDNTAGRNGDNWHAAPGMLYETCCTTPDPGGTGCVTNDPLFVEAASGDYHLQTGSPCIDAGSAGATTSRDLDGIPRPLDGDGNGTATVDMGCYEYASAAVDSDGDGMNDRDELIADTDPTDAGDCFRITGISRNSPVTVHFESSSRRRYTLVGRSSLDVGGWSVVAVKTGAGGLDSLSDTSQPSQGPFYRLEVARP